MWIFEYLWKALDSIPFVRYLRLLISKFVRHHPWTVISMFLIGAIYVFFFPESWPAEWILPKHKCHVIDARDGRSFTTGVTRECDPNGLVAVVLYDDWSNRSDKPKRMKITAGMLATDFALDPAQPGSNGWRQVALTGVEAKQPPKQQGGFPFYSEGQTSLYFKVGGCGFDPAEETEKEYRKGFSLISTDRYDPGLSDEQKHICGYGGSKQSGFPLCGWRRYEIFVPAMQPKDWCAERTLRDYWNWNWSATWKIDFSSNLEQLRRLANDGSDVSDSQWDELTKGLPKLCMRTVGAEINPDAPKSKWEAEYAIGERWCDQRRVE
jgi:hypothetical protein